MAIVLELIISAIASNSYILAGSGNQATISHRQAIESMGGVSVDNDRESAIQLHLQEWLEVLERRLANPKNNWKRCEEIQAQIEDAKKRLAAVQRRDKRFSTRRSYAPRRDAGRSPQPVRSSGW